MTRRTPRFLVLIAVLAVVVLQAFVFLAETPVVLAYNSCNLIGSTANDDAYNAVEDVALIVPAPGYLANDTCADGVTGINVGALGAAFTEVAPESDGRLVVDFATDFAGPASLTYRFVGTYGTSNWATISFNVAAVDDPPGLRGSCGPFTDIGENEGPQTLPCFGAVPGGGPDECSQALTGHVGLDSISNQAMFATEPAFTPTKIAGTCTWSGALTFTPANHVGGGFAVLDLWVSDNGDVTNGGASASKILKVSVAVLTVAQPVITPSPTPAATPRPTVVPPNAAPTTVADASTRPSASASLPAAASPPATIVASATNPPLPTSSGSASASDQSMWITIVAVALVLVIGLNAVLFQMLRRRSRSGRGS